MIRVDIGPNNASENDVFMLCGTQIFSQAYHPAIWQEEKHTCSCTHKQIQIFEVLNTLLGDGN